VALRQVQSEIPHAAAPGAAWMDCLCAEAENVSRPEELVLHCAAAIKQVLHAGYRFYAR
jgi:hypothetical protein